MRPFPTLIQFIFSEVSQEIKKRDVEIEKLKTALAGAQAENREVWRLVEEMRRDGQAPRTA